MPTTTTTTTPTTSARVRGLACAGHKHRAEAARVSDSQHVLEWREAHLPCIWGGAVGDDDDEDDDDGLLDDGAKRTESPSQPGSRCTTYGWRARRVRQSLKTCTVGP